MNLNCKPGDLAVVVCGGLKINHGRIIRVLLPVAHPQSRILGWTYEGHLDHRIFSRVGYVADNCLRPIRDQPGTDETLTWAGKPAAKEKVVVFTTEAAAESFVIDNPTWTAKVRRDGVVISTFFGACA